MRSSLWILWIPLALMTGCAVGPSEPGGADAGATGPTWTVKGYGETPNDARELAMGEGAFGRGHLESRYPNIGWRPTIQRLLAERVVQVDEAKQSQLDQLKGYEATAHVDLRDANFGKTADRSGSGA